MSLLGGTRGVVRVPLLDLELRDIGKASGGVTFWDASAQMFRALYTAILKAVTQSGALLPRGREQLGQSAEDLGKTVEKAGKALLEGLFRE